MVTNGKPRVVVLGGGFAGLETAFYLRSKLGSAVDLTLVSAEDAFLFKPNTIYIPFGADPDSLRIPLALPTARRSIRFVQGGIGSVDLDARRVRVPGQELRYDYLVIATGASMRPEEIPGLETYAETIWTPSEMESLGEKLERACDRARGGEKLTVLFNVPPFNKCAGPLYEMVFMIETWLRREGIRDRFRLLYTTFEKSYIQAFGPKLDNVVTDEFGAREIEGQTNVRLLSVDRGHAYYEDGQRIPYDLLVAFPPYAAAVDYPGLPHDGRGFLETEPGSRRVVGQERVFAPGDAGDFPVKQAFLAFLQADAVAETIAAEVLDREPTFAFDPVSMCVMEELDKATFAQVPLQVTGDPNRPVIVRPDADGAYRVGVSPAWRLGKKLLGLYLPMRFKAGLPFHAGLPWRAMDLGLKGMSAALARK
jgi:sulfide:quinone oxidoreductase